MGIEEGVTLLLGVRWLRGWLVGGGEERYGEGEGRKHCHGIFWGYRASESIHYYGFLYSSFWLDHEGMF